MNAAYRLIGNFPSRGFGESLSSAEFSSSAAIVTGTDARLPMSGVPHSREPQKVGEVTESYHAYEIHPLSFGQLTVLYSATGKMMQATGATRPCSFTNFVTWAGEDVPSFVSDDASICSMLRYNDFVTIQEFWGLPKEITTLPSKPWSTDESIRLDYDAPVPISDEMLRSLLTHYWRCASLSFFGPWDTGKKAACLYQSDLLMQYITKRDRNVSVCISASDDCHTIVPQAKGFLWQCILNRLPKQVRNITSMAAAVPLQLTQSMYRDAALCVVYPNAEAKFNLVNGKFPKLAEDEDAFMQQVLSGDIGLLMKKLHNRYIEVTGQKDLDNCPFMADYDLALSLYRMEHAEDDWNLLINWYAAQCHLNMRHDIKGRTASRIMQDVDAFAKARLNEREEMVAQLLLAQTDRNHTLMSKPLQSFLWEKAVYSEDRHPSPAGIVTRCQGEHALCFFTEFTSAQTVPEDTQATENMAALISSILNTYHLDTQLTNTHIQQLLKVAPAYRQSNILVNTFAAYLNAYTDKHPQEHLRLLQLSTQYLDTDKQIGKAFEMLMTSRLDEPLNEEECKALLHVLPNVQDPAAAHETLTNYITLLYHHTYPEINEVAAIVSHLRMDTSAALIRLFTQTPGWDHQLDEKTFALVLGQNAAVDCMLAHARHIPEVEQAFRAYMKHRLDVSISTKTAQYDWAVTTINRALPTRFYTDANAKSGFLAWCTALIMEYTLAFASASVTLPSEKAFARTLSLASQKSPAFTDRIPRVRDTYEKLLQNGVAGAEIQCQQLAPYLHGIAENSLLQAATSTYVSRFLQNEWKREKFWQVLNRKDIIGHINRNGALPVKIFDEETKNAARQTIRREVLAAISDPRQYQKLQADYVNQENIFRRTVSLPGILTDNTISIIWHDAITKCFQEQFEGFFLSCQSIDQAHSLLKVMESITNAGVQRTIRDSHTGRIILLLIEIQGFIGNVPEEKLLIHKTMEWAGKLREKQSEKAISLLQTECDARINESAFFIQRLSLALLQATRGNGVDWKSFLHALQPNMDNMLHNPYASGSLPLLSSISSALRVFDCYPTNDELLQNFIGYLKTDSVMASYTSAVKKDQKSLAHFFPGLANSRSLSLWLGK